MPKVINWVETQIPFGEDNSLVTVVTNAGFTRHWEQSHVTIDGKAVKALMYRTDVLCVYLHTDLRDFSGDNAVTVKVYDGDWERPRLTNLRLVDGGNAVYSVEQIIELALGKDALKWA